MHNYVRHRREKLEAKITELHGKITELQETCRHDNLTYKCGGSSGNYDPSADCYWIDWHCEDCGKRWTTDQDNIYHLTKVVYPQARDITRTRS